MEPDWRTALGYHYRLALRGCQEPGEECVLERGAEGTSPSKCFQPTTAAHSYNPASFMSITGPKEHPQKEDAWNAGIQETGK
jgi:hypothetical protein